MRAPYKKSNKKKSITENTYKVATGVIKVPHFVVPLDRIVLQCRHRAQSSGTPAIGWGGGGAVCVGGGWC